LAGSRRAFHLHLSSVKTSDFNPGRKRGGVSRGSVARSATAMTMPLARVVGGAFSADRRRGETPVEAV
jgi:hypothetical protein